MIVVFLTILFCITNGDLILDGSKLERRFDGIGGLSGGGATSRFLPSYQEPYISEILDYLFLPNFGASLHMLKVEMGGDCQTTEGTESSHMHTRDDLNYERGYEWWLMTEAKKRNPDILLYALTWGVPGWIGDGNFFSEDNIDYHIKWLQGAKQVYGLDIDYVGVWNERSYDVSWIMELRTALNASGFNNTQIVAHDATWDIVGDMQKNEQFKEDVAIIGVHYPGTTSPTAAQQLGNPLWASEDYSTYADSTGGGCWARILNQNYVNGYMTSTISWNLVASYYTSLPFPGCGLMYAEHPWSGHYDVQSPIWVSAHTTQFTKPGWIYLAHGNGTDHLPNGGSYVTLVPPNNSEGDFSLIIETMTHDHSECIRPSLPSYTVTPQNVTFQIQGGLATNKPLYVWYTHLNQSQQNIYFEQIKTITPENGQFTLELDLDSVWTVSTLTGQKKGSHPTPPAATDFPKDYSDNFEGYTVGQEANYFADQTGVWEIYKGNTSLVMRQQVVVGPIEWCGESNRPISLIGDSSESDTVLTIDALIETSGSVGVGARVQQGGCGDNYAAGGYFFDITDKGDWTLASNKTILKQGTTTFSADQFYTLSLVANGTSICATINNKLVDCIQDYSYTHGFASIGTGWNYAQFDNFRLQRYSSGCGDGDLVKTEECGGNAYQGWEFADDGTVQLINTSLCLEANGTSAGASVRTLPCNNKLQSQIWKYSGTAITSAVNGMCLDITGQSTNICAAVEIYYCNGGSNQQWTKNGDYLVSGLDGLCLAGEAL
eukprot:Phypoly_transcript_03132.p1 GENE.Phypoly_transcript_03132~~Phypoly_transcript_03132.p1  ORF type:complete len:773 (+),score=122.26 Phypoly_transcript_03132:204-2522(+)